MDSGIKPSEEVKDVFFNKLNKSRIKAFIVKIEGTEMKIEKEFEKENFSYEEFAKAFPEDEGRIACIELQKKTDDGVFVNKIACFIWSPMSAKALKKMKYSTSFNSFKNDFTQIAISFQTDSREDITQEKFLKKI